MNPSELQVHLARTHIRSRRQGLTSLSDLMSPSELSSSESDPSSELDGEDESGPVNPLTLAHLSAALASSSFSKSRSSLFASSEEEGRPNSAFAGFGRWLSALILQKYKQI